MSKDEIIKWLAFQWNKSFACSIWRDLTPFGRCTIWIPLYLLCLASIPVVLFSGLVAYVAVFLLYKPLAWIHRQLFIE